MVVSTAPRGELTGAPPIASLGGHLSSNSGELVPVNSTNFRSPTASIWRCLGQMGQLPMRLFGPQLVVGLVVTMSGCGPVLYTSALGDAREAVAQAEAERADVRAPHPFRLAQEYLLKAEEEALSGAYGNALAHAEAAELRAEEALAAAVATEPDDDSRLADPKGRNQ